MIISFKHKGLKAFFLTGSTKGIQADHARKISVLLTRLHTISAVEDMDLMGANLHKLKGSLKDHWSVKVSGNWRITFKFTNGNAEIVDYQDYH